MWFKIYTFIELVVNQSFVSYNFDVLCESMTTNVWFHWPRKNSLHTDVVFCQLDPRAVKVSLIENYSFIIDKPLQT